jgi:hypothetical protein
VGFFPNPPCIHGGLNIKHSKHILKGDIKMSLKKLVVILTALCIMSAVNMFALAQSEDKDKQTTSQTEATVTVTTPAPSPGAAPSSGSAVVTPHTSGEKGRAVNRSISVQTQGVDPKVQEALRKAEAEMIKIDRQLKELGIGDNREIVQKTREEIQKAMQKARDEMQKAKQQYERTVKESSSVRVLPGTGMDPFYGRGGYGGGIGGGYGGASVGFGGRRVQLDNRTGQMIITSPESVEIITGPEANELRERENNIKDEIQAVVEKYNDTQNKDERANLKKKLEELVNQQFEIRQKYREMQVDRLEKELARIRESIQKRNENRQQIIQRYIAQLLNEEDDLAF